MFARLVLLFGPPPDPATNAILAAARVTFPPAILHHPPLALPICRFDARPGVWTVRQAADIPTFASATQENLVYLDSPGANNVSSLWLTGPGLSVSYEPVQIAQIVDDLADSPTVPYSRTRGRLFREIAGPRAGFTPIRVVSGPVAPGQSVLNPFVLRFDRGRSELSPPTDTLLQILLGEGKLLACEPAYRPDLRARVAARRTLAGRLRDRGGPLSVFDKLLFGDQFPRDTEDWGAAALGLDALGGLFLIRNASGPAPDLRWVWPPDQSGNERWLATHWRSEWGGHESIPIATTLLAAEPSLPGFNFRPLPLPPEFLATASALLGGLEPPLSAPVEFVQALLQGLPPDDDAQRSHHGAVRYASPFGRLEIDETMIVDQFVRRHVLPRSPSCLCFPSAFPVIREPRSRDDPEAAARLTEVCRDLGLNPAITPRLAGWAFLQRYLLALAQPLAGGRADIRLRFGWWTDWYDRLFDTPDGVRFVSSPGPVTLNRSYLDEALLGPTEGDYDPRHPMYL